MWSKDLIEVEWIMVMNQPLPHNAVGLFHLVIKLKKGLCKFKKYIGCGIDHTICSRVTLSLLLLIVCLLSSREVQRGGVG